MKGALLPCFMVAGFLFTACGKRESSTQATNAASSGNPITAPVDYLGAAGRAKRAAEKTVDTLGVNQAIQLFQAQEGRLPKNLNELVTQKYLPSIPSPPAGTKYDYNPQTGQVRLVAAQ